jgi:hypothetical protein
MLLSVGVQVELSKLFENKSMTYSNVLGPFLLNIYMAELDKKIIEIRKRTKDIPKTIDCLVCANIDLSIEKDYVETTSDCRSANSPQHSKARGSEDVFLKSKKVG